MWKWFSSFGRVVGMNGMIQMESKEIGQVTKLDMPDTKPDEREREEKK